MLYTAPVEAQVAKLITEALSAFESRKYDAVLCRPNAYCVPAEFQPFLRFYTALSTSTTSIL